MSPHLISLADTVFERVAPFYVLFDVHENAEILSEPLRNYWKVTDEVNEPQVCLIRPFRRQLQASLFPELTEMQLTLCWGDQEDSPLRGELMPVDDGRWVFVGSPPISSFASLQEHGFYLSDLPAVSGVGDAIIAVESAQISLQQAQKALDDLQASNSALSNLNQAFGRFVPSAFLESLGLKNASEVQLGDHASVRVSVMFGDLRGFTTMSERMSSQQIFAFLNRFLVFVAPNIRKHSGFVVHYIGDGLLALFAGQPDNSVRAAVDMQRALAEALAVGGLGDLSALEKPPRLGIGLSFGSVEMGIIGESGRWDATVISDSVNVAARLQEFSKALGAQILITNDLKAAMNNPESFHLRRVGHIPLRGRNEKVEIFEVLDALPLADRTLRVLNRATLEKAIREFEEGLYAQAKDRFIQYLKICPNDPAALYYIELGKQSLKHVQLDDFAI